MTSTRVPDLTTHQQRIFELIKGRFLSLDEIAIHIGPAAAGNIGIAGSFMQKLGKRLGGSWWNLERRGMSYGVFMRTVRQFGIYRNVEGGAIITVTERLPDGSMKDVKTYEISSIGL